MAIRRYVRVLKTAFALMPIGIAALVFLLWLDHTRETTLPAPTGAFAVGRAMYVWSDLNHFDPMATQTDTRRELLAWIWYPAVPPDPSQKTAAYLPRPWLHAVERQRGTLNKLFLTRDLSLVRTHSIEDAQVSMAQRA